MVNPVLDSYHLKTRTSAGETDRLAGLYERQRKTHNRPQQTNCQVLAVKRGDTARYIDGNRWTRNVRLGLVLRTIVLLSMHHEQRDFSISPPHEPLKANCFCPGFPSFLNLLYSATTTELQRAVGDCRFFFFSWLELFRRRFLWSPPRVWPLYAVVQGGNAPLFGWRTDNW